MNAAAEGKAGFCAGGNIEHNAVECFQGDFTHVSMLLALVAKS